MWAYPSSSPQLVELPFSLASMSSSAYSASSAYSTSSSDAYWSSLGVHVRAGEGMRVGCEAAAVLRILGRGEVRMARIRSRDWMREVGVCDEVQVVRRAVLGLRARGGEVMRGVRVRSHGEGVRVVRKYRTRWRRWLAGGRRRWRRRRGRHWRGWDARRTRPKR
ncbi:hypothetical protein DFH09DRAFT_1128476 [Mycena vulgaris]|nr:hypothetical protein DFH09DRAFT_1128476 [Mycena vulgaris]